MISLLFAPLWSQSTRTFRRAMLVTQGNEPRAKREVRRYFWSFLRARDQTIGMGIRRIHQVLMLFMTV